MRCILCGRKTKPAVMLADKPVGPKCAARAGLIDRARRKQGMVRLATPAPRPDTRTLDLFEVAA